MNRRMRTRMSGGVRGGAGDPLSLLDLAAPDLNRHDQTDRCKITSASVPSKLRVYERQTCLVIGGTAAR